MWGLRGTVIVLLVCLMGCGDSEDTGANTSQRVAGRQFIVYEVSVLPSQDDPVQVPISFAIEPQNLMMTFDGTSRVIGQKNCNSFVLNGFWESSGVRFRIQNTTNLQCDDRPGIFPESISLSDFFEVDVRADRLFLISEAQGVIIRMRESLRGS